MPAAAKAPHIHYWGCVHCGDPKVCSKCMKCPCRLRRAQEQLRLAKMGKGWLDAYYLDILLESGIKIDRLIGVNVDWHGRKALTVKRPDSWKPMSGQAQKYVLALLVRLPCDNGCKRRVQITVKSGVHHGAFCVVIDRNGNRLADLRDKNVLCGKCA
jgi:hypothetical protein